MRDIWAWEDTIVVRGDLAANGKCMMARINADAKTRCHAKRRHLEKQGKVVRMVEMEEVEEGWSGMAWWRGWGGLMRGRGRERGSRSSWVWGRM
jgi:hypothetical protein